MSTLLSRIRKERPELTFDKKGNLIESDKELADSLLSKFPAKDREELRPYLYAPLPEKESGLLDTVAGFGKEVLSAVGPTVEDVPEETVAARLRRTNPRLSKASDEGLARYLKIEQADPRSMDEIKDSLSKLAVERTQELIDESKQREEKRAQEKVNQEQPSSQDSPFSLESSARQREISRGVEAVSSIDTTKAEDVFGGIVDNIVAKSGSLASGASSYIGDTLAGFVSPTEDLQKLRRENLAALTTGQVAGSKRLTEEQIQNITESNYSEQFGDTLLNARDAIQSRTDQLIGAINAGVERREGRVAPLRSSAVQDYVKEIDEASSLWEVGAATGKLLKELGTTPEGLFVVSDSVPVILAASVTSNPAVGAFLGSAATRLGEKQRGKTGDERRESFSQDVERSSLAAMVDTVAIMAGMKLAKAKVSAPTQASGQVGLGSVSEAGGDFVASPDSSTGELAAAAVLGGAISGPAEVYGVLASRGDLSPQEAQKVQELESTGDPLDQAEANLIKSPPPILSEERASVPKEPVQQELPLPEGEARPPVNLEQEAVEKVAAAKKKAAEIDSAYAERDFQKQEKLLLEEYDSALNSGDSLAEAKAEQALDRLYKQPEPDTPAESTTSPEQPATQQELPLEGGVQPSQNLEKPLRRPQLEERRSKVTPALVEKTYKDLAGDKYKLKPSDVRAIRQEAGKEGGDLNLPPRELFNRLSEDGQNRVIGAVAQTRTQVTKVVPKERAERIVSSLNPKPQESVSAPSKQEGVTPTIPQQEKVQQRASQEPSEGVVDTTKLRERIEGLRPSRFKTEVLDLVAKGTDVKEAASTVLNSLRESGSVVGQAARIDSEFNLSVDNADRPPLPPIEGAPSIINKARTKKGIDFSPAPTPNTAKAKLADKLAKSFGLNLTWVQSPNSNERGAQSGADIAVNVNSNSPVLKVLGHEINHALERKPEYASRVNQALDQYKNQKGLQREKAKKRVAKYELNQLAEEVRSDLFGEAVEDPNFFRALRKITGSDSLFDKIVTFIQDIINRVRGRVTRLDKTVGEATTAAVNDVQQFRQALLDAVEASKSEPVVRQEATEEVSLDLTRPEDEVATVKQQVATRSKSLAGKVGSAVASGFRARGSASTETFQATREVERGKASSTKEHERLIYNFKRAIDKAGIDKRTADAILRGREQPANPEVKQAVEEIRREITNQTLTIIEEGAAPAKDVEKLLANLDDYVHRSYHAFLERPGKWKEHLQAERIGLWKTALSNIEVTLDIPNDLASQRSDTINRLASWWDISGEKSKADKISELEKIRDNADSYLQRRREAAAKIRDELADPSTSVNPFVTQFSNAMKGSGNILKERSALPDWLKKFWGEVKDGTFNAAVTLENQANLIWHNRVMDKLGAQLLAKGLASPTARPGMEKVDASGGPLAGLYVNSADYQYLKGNQFLEPDPNSLTGWQGNLVLAGKALGAAVRKVNSLSKTNSVVFDLSAFSVQALSTAVSAPLLLGTAPSKAAVEKGLVAAITDTMYHDNTKASAVVDFLSNLFGKDLRNREYVTKLIEEGVAGEGVYTGELKDMLKALTGDTKLLTEAGDVSGIDLRATITQAYFHAMNATRKTGQVFSKGFQFVDTFSRSVIKETQLEQLSKWHPEWSKEKLNEEAARRTRAMMPTYSETWPVARTVARYGIGNSFATFLAEQYRNIGNNAQIAYQDITGEGNPTAQRRAGVQRMLGTGLAVGMYSQVMAYVAGEIKDLLQDDDVSKEDNKKLDSLTQEDMRVLAPEFFNNSPFIYPVALQDDKLVYINTGRFIMHEPMAKFVTHALNGDLNAGAGALLDDIASLGFVGNLGLSLTTAAVGKAVDDNRLVRKGLREAGRDVERTYIPGTINRAVIKPARREREGRPMTTSQRLAELGGLTQLEVNLRDVADRTFRNWAEDSRNSRTFATQDELFDNSTLRVLFDSKELTQDEVTRMYATWVKADKEAFDEAVKTLEVLEKVLDKSELTAIRKDAGVSEDNFNYLLSGKYRLPNPNESGTRRRDFFLNGAEREKKKANKDKWPEIDTKWRKLRGQLREAKREVEKNLEEIY